MKKQKKVMRLFSLLLVSVFLVVGCQPKPQSKANETSDKEEVVNSLVDNQDAQEYLKTIFGVAFSDSVTKEELQIAGETIVGNDRVKIDGELTGLSLMKYANQLGDYDELTMSYGEEKVKKSLKKWDLSTDIDDKFASYVASSADINLLDKKTITKLIKADKVSGEQVTEVMMAVADVTGKGRNYLGDSDDPSIYRKLEDSFNSFVLFKDKALGDFGAKAVADEVVTGYNMKLNSYDANFLPDRTIIYGHSDIRHAHQLIGLLNSENLNVKVQLEPKVSIFQYLLEWGPIPEPVPTYFVEKVGDLHLVNAVEYDLALEFKDTKEMEQFDRVIEEYAKKSDENEVGEGMIAASWWQPFLKTDNESLPKDRFYEVYDGSISNELYSMHSMVLPEDKDRVEKRFNEMKSSATIEMTGKYCNLAFYNYLKGDDYQ